MMALHIPDHNRRGIRLESRLGNIQLIVTLGCPAVPELIGMENQKRRRQKSKQVSVGHSAGLEWKSDR